LMPGKTAGKYDLLSELGPNFRDVAVSWAAKVLTMAPPWERRRRALPSIPGETTMIETVWHTRQLEQIRWDLQRRSRNARGGQGTVREFAFVLYPSIQLLASVTRAHALDPVAQLG
jgi:hypothetical protein